MSSVLALTEQEFGKLIIAGATSGSPSASRDVALLYVLFMTGLMPSEIAGLKISDFLNSDNKPLTTSKVRSEISFNGKERPLYWSNLKLLNSLSIYIGSRQIQNRDDPLFLSKTGSGFSYRKTVRNGSVYYSCASLTNLFNNLFISLGFHGINTSSARKTLAIWLYEQRASVDEISIILGQSNPSITRRMLKGIESVPVCNLIRNL